MHDNTLHDVYLIGSLKNELVIQVGKHLRAAGLRVFDSWYAAGPDADDYLRDYERYNLKDYREAIRGYAAMHTFQFDYEHINRSRAGVLVMPAGKSGHLELGYMIGQGKPGYILFSDEPERFEVMHNFANDIFFDVDELAKALRRVLDVHN